MKKLLNEIGFSIENWANKHLNIFAMSCSFLTFIYFKGTLGHRLHVCISGLKAITSHKMWVLLEVKGGVKLAVPSTNEIPLCRYAGRCRCSLTLKWKVVIAVGNQPNFPWKTSHYLLVTKAIINRFLVQLILCDQFHLATANNLQQSLTIQSGNTQFSLATGSCDGTTDWSLGMCG